MSHSEWRVESGKWKVQFWGILGLFVWIWIGLKGVESEIENCKYWTCELGD